RHAEAGPAVEMRGPLQVPAILWSGPPDFGRIKLLQRRLIQGRGHHSLRKSPRLLRSSRGTGLIEPAIDRNDEPRTAGRLRWDATSLFAAWLLQVFALARFRWGFRG